MFYQLKYDMDLVDKVIEKKKCYIYGAVSYTHLTLPTSDLV